MTACRFTSRTEPRILPGRHADECADETCAGCQPCAEVHCAVCRRAHVALGTCAECVAEARDDLRQIAELCGALPAETVHRGVDSEAAMLWGPTADVEARGHVEASYLSGRLPEGWLERAHGKKCPRLINEPCLGCAGDDRHPLTTLGTWEMVWRDHLEQPTDLQATLPRLVDYLDAHLHEMAAVEVIPFEDFAHDLRACRGHLQDVLRDQNRGDVANVGCFECGSPLERKLTEHGFEDHWTCRQCRRRYTYAEYNFALRAALEESA